MSVIFRMSNAMRANWGIASRRTVKMRGRCRATLFAFQSSATHATGMALAATGRCVVRVAKVLSIGIVALTLAQLLVHLASPGTQRAFLASSATSAELDPRALEKLGQAIADCWEVPSNADPASLRFQILPDGQLGSSLRADMPIDGSGLTLREGNSVESAVVALNRCAPYTEVIALDWKIASLFLRLHIDPSVGTVTVELAPIAPPTPEQHLASDPKADATSAVALVLEIERNEAAAMQKRSKQSLYWLVPTRTLYEEGVVYLEQQVGANNVVYATIYCAFNETEIDANRILLGKEQLYSAVLYDVTHTQRYADSGAAFGIINHKEIMLSSCEMFE